MCWEVHIGDKTANSRDELEAIIGERAFYRGDDEGLRLEADHCLCPIDVPCTLVYAGYSVRGWREGDFGMPGDWFAEPPAPGDGA